MKKILTLIAFSLWMLNCTIAGERVIAYKELPKPAQEFVNAHFVDQKVVTVNVTQSWTTKEYKTVLTNGNYILFDKKGNWKGVICGRNTAPDKIIPAEIHNHIANTYPKAKVTEILRRSNGGYEIKLTNGYHVRFNNKLKAVYTDIK